LLTRRQNIRHILFETSNSYPGIRIDKGIFYLTKNSTIKDLRSAIKYCKSEFKILIPKDITLIDIFDKKEIPFKSAFSNRIYSIKEKIYNLHDI
jgi:hypothetical protein